jgi:predicted ribosome quality control (RQC) complex YloA/Tae2 family protein
VAEATPLLLLLRKYVRDGRVEAVEQVPLERVLKLRVTKRHDDGSARSVWLIVEPMGRRSNVVLVDDDGAVLDALKRVGPALSPARPVLPHWRYVPPPPQDRLDPLAPGTWAQLRDEVARGVRTPSERAPTLAELLAGRVMGLSPQAAREAAFRATGAPDAPLGPQLDWVAVRDAVRGLLGPLAGGVWEPCVVRRAGQVVAFAPYRLTHLAGGQVEPMPDISAALNAFYAEPARPRPHQTVLSLPLLKAIDERRRAVERKLASLERALAELRDADELRLKGEAVLACSGSIATGQDRVQFDGRTIELDPRLSAVENAQRYFRAYRKAREAARRVPELLEQARLELAYLGELRTLAELADNPAKLRALRAELELGRAGGEGSEPARPAPQPRSGKRKPPPPGGRPLRVTSADGLEILVGTSARGNEEVTFKHAGPEDIWLHARGVPGAHVILRTHGRPAPERSLLEAARLAARHSAARQDGTVPVDWTPRRLVKKVPGGPPGLVRYSGERTLVVEPAADHR